MMAGSERFTGANFTFPQPEITGKSLDKCAISACMRRLLFVTINRCENKINDNFQFLK